MKFDEIRAQWEEDAVFDIYDIANEIARVPKLHSKYLDYLMVYRAKVKKLEQNLAVAKRELTDHYMGRSDKPSPVRIIKQEASTYIAADAEYQSVEEKLEFARQCVYWLEQVIDRIKFRSNDLRIALDWQKFTGGPG